MKRFRWMMGLPGIGIACAVLTLSCGCATMEEPGEASADGDLRAVVTQRLALDPLTRSGIYGVEVVGDEVILRGTVRNEAERMRILSIVRGVPGIGRVTDRLRILP